MRQSTRFSQFIPSTAVRITALLLCAGLSMAGCTDGFTSYEEASIETVPYDGPKFRHAHLLDQAFKAAPGKSSSDSDLGLIVAVPNGIDKQRVTERYKIADRYRVTGRYDYENVFNGFAWIVDDTTGSDDFQAFLDLLAQDPDILWFEPDFEVNSPPSTAMQGGSGQQVPWSVAAVGGQASWAISGDGQGAVNVDIYVLDTGVGNAGNNNSGDDLAIVESLDFRDGYNDGIDYDGHGTHIAGIAAAVDDADGLVGLAPGARIHNFKVLGDEGQGSVSDVIAAVEEITARRLASPSIPVVVNLSLGDDVYTTEYTALDEAVAASVASGAVYVIAAGNQGINTASVSPAKVETAITVGAFDMNGGFSDFSNYGAKVDLLAPGENVVSLSRSNGPVKMSGTSMAAAHVTGAAALYLAQNSTATPAQVAAALRGEAQAFVTGTPWGTTNKSVWVGGETTTTEVRVDKGRDDAEEYDDGDMYLNSSDLEMAYEGSSAQTIGMRFSDIGIPQGATIVNAYIQFTVDETDSGPASLTIHGQDSDDASSFHSNDYNITSRPLTSASVAWSPPAWTSVGAAGAAQRTPDLSAILQEMVNRPGWEADDLVIIVSGTGERTAESYNGSSNKAPLLHVEWVSANTDDDDD